MRTKPLVIAHKGNAGEAPENTRIAFGQALDLGVDMIELDVNRTKDGVAVIWHGPGLEEATGLDASIRDLTADEARDLDIGSWKGEAFAGQRLLTLAEALDLMGGRVVLALDLKAFDIIPRIVREVRDAGLADGVQFCGCTVPEARMVHDCDAELSVGLNMDSGMVRLAESDAESFAREYVNQAAKNRLAPLNVSHRFVTRDVVRRAHLRAIPVWAWTVDDQQEMARLIDLGVDAIYTNFPRRLLELLGRAGCG